MRGTQVGNTPNLKVELKGTDSVLISSSELKTDSSKRLALCPNLTLHAHGGEKVSLPPLKEIKKEKKRSLAWSSLVTASMNEKQLRGMLHYVPISGTGGGVLVASSH